ncbi:ATP-dependent RecD-like DNA helicase [Campylobacter sp. 19-13652]|uniref:ATP-dependent DNA helicase n=1 Tax=Campylobacter sp. 19-13652 TaxID=2840180 RepID=UPI001C74A691|nr:ATP-dependent RecD-like DNA helicase [Campylobacter sp. 19-13652]BCX79941.1 helicase [Campylobacter sp. 19-13652]
MDNLLSKIYDLDKNICKNIDKSSNERGFLAQNILGNLRTFVEYVSLYICAKEQKLGAEIKYYNIKCAPSKIKNLKKEFRFLSDFHHYLQIVTSHYIQTEDNSQRLMLKYYSYLVRLKNIFSEKYNIKILHNLNLFPLDLDPKFTEYYEKIFDRLNNFRLIPESRRDRFYIHKVKPIVLNDVLFYEISLSIATDNASKFDRIIAFSKEEPPRNYSISASILKDGVSILNKTMPINIIYNMEVSIRYCEYKNFAYIFSNSKNIGKTECERISKYISNTGSNLLDIVLMNDDEYLRFKNHIDDKKIAITFLNILDKCRDIVLKKKSSANIIRYLLFTMKNKVIKNQWQSQENNLINNLYLTNGVIPFDQMPFATSLIKHNPKLKDLLKCIDYENRRCEFLARKILNNAEINKQLYTDVQEAKDTLGAQDIEKLIKEFNSKLYKTHKNRELCIRNNKIFIKGYEDNIVDVINTIKKFCTNGVMGYVDLAKRWLDENDIDDSYKKETLQNIFTKSRVAFVCGAAGTGKSTLLRYISEIFFDKDKIYLAQTNPAVENLKTKVSGNNKNTKTISKFLDKKNQEIECDILFIDECSTVSNEDMVKILKKAKFNLLILSGDTYQIEAIKYGNWFDVLRYFLPKHCIYELKNPYRSDDKNLLDFWSNVRDNKCIAELMATYNYVFELGDDIFNKDFDDEIVLCLNYDGLYGVNNINHFLQSANKSNTVAWGIWIFKENDPVVFNENNIFSTVLHNNLKGAIKFIQDREHEVYFEVEVDKIIADIGLTQELKLISVSNGKSIVGFSVNKIIDSDSDDAIKSVPFSISYAVSIHKSQGLEYDSVKIVITDEVGEQITHNIFYTAITRAKRKLKIYCSAETQEKMLSSFMLSSSKKDADFIKGIGLV